MSAMPAAGRSRVPGFLILLGAALTIASAFVTWFEGSVFTEGEATGIGLTVGIAVVFFAAVVLVLGIVFAARSRGGRILSSFALAIAVLLLLLPTAYAAFAPETAIATFEASNFAEQNPGLELTDTEAKAVLEQGFENGQIDAKAATGVYLALVGALLATAGAVGGIVVGGRKDAIAAPPVAQPYPSAPPPDAPAPPPPPPEAPPAP